MKQFVKIFPIALGAIFFLVLGFWLGDHFAPSKQAETTTESTEKPVVKKENKEDTGKDKKELENKLQQKGNQWAKDYPNSLEYRVYDLGTKQSYTYTNNDEKNKKYVTASIAKVAVAMMLLHEKEENQKELTDKQTELLNRMIVSSDNEATTSLWESLGGYSALQEFFDERNMKDTKANEETWGKTTTTTKDQIKLLQELYTPSEYLTEESQDEIIDLMSRIEPDQSWGVYAGSSNVSFKNGWIIDDVDDQWVVNSIGKVSRKDKSYLAVALSDKNPTIEEGSRVIEDLVRITSDYLL